MSEDNLSFINPNFKEINPGNVLTTSIGKHGFLGAKRLKQKDQELMIITKIKKVAAKGL